MTLLPLRAIQVGDQVEFGLNPDDHEVVEVTERFHVGSFFAPSWVRLVFADGEEFEGEPDTLMVVEELSFSDGLDKILGLC